MFITIIHVSKNGLLKFTTKLDGVFKTTDIAQCANPYQMAANLCHCPALQLIHPVLYILLLI